MRKGGGEKEKGRLFNKQCCENYLFIWEKEYTRINTRLTKHFRIKEKSYSLISF